MHYTGIDTDFFCPNPTIPRLPIVLFVGRLVPNKGCEYLIRAVTRVQEVMPEIKLVVIGHGPQREQLEQQAAACLRNFEFLGAQPPALVRNWMNRAKVFSSPSLVTAIAQEGFGMVFVEAQAMGLPVVSCPVGGIPEGVAHEQTGFLVPERDSEALRLNYFFYSRTKTYGQNSVKQDRPASTRLFNLRKQAALLENIYEGTLTAWNRRASSRMNQNGQQPPRPILIEAELNNPPHKANSQTGEPMDRNNKVSAVIPTRNRPHLVLRAVRSALAQTYKHLEVIVVVDGPDAVTSDALATIRDVRLRVITLPQSQGAQIARNTGIEAAQGDWIALLDDDDEWLPEKTGLQIERAQSSKFRYPIISSQFVFRTPNYELVWPRRQPYEPLSEYLLARNSLSMGEGLLSTITLFFPKDLFRYASFTPDLKRCQEVDWVLRASRQDGAGIEFIPQPLAVANQAAERASITRCQTGGPL